MTAFPAHSNELVWCKCGHERNMHRGGIAVGGNACGANTWIDSAKGGDLTPCVCASYEGVK